MKQSIKIFLLLLVLTSALVSCEPTVVIDSSTSTSGSSSDTIKMGYRSIFSYQYLPYTADSAAIQFYIEERDSAKYHYTNVEFTIGEDTIWATSLPQRIDYTIPLIDDSTIVIKHECWVNIDDSIIYREPVSYSINVHKGEIVNPNPDTIHSTLYDFLIILSLDASTNF